MDRLRPPPPRLPLRAWIFCVVLAVALLLRSGAPLLDALQLLAGILPLDQEGQTVAHVLLARSLKSFVLVSFALAAGLSFALAAAMLVSRLGGRASRLTGWLGGAFAYVPPMGWALGAIFFLIRVRHLPVETLFPFPPTSGDDSWTVVVARTLWAWLVPVLVLAVPVFGTALYSLTHRLSALLNNPKLFQLNARGLGHSQIVFRHLVPQLRVHLARLARPCAAMLLAYDVPVEELLGFNGWGRYVAGKLSEPGANTAALAGALWMAGWMLAGCLAWLGLLDKKGLPQLAEETRDSSQKRSWRAVVSGSLIAISLVKLPELAVYYSWWPSAAASHAAWADELQRAGMISSGALLLVLLCGPAMCLTRNWRWVLNRGVAASFGVVPLLLTLILFEHGMSRNWFVITLAAALPGLAAFRDTFRDDEQSTLTDAAHSLGRKSFAVWWHHLLPDALPGLMGWALRNTGTVMLTLAVLDFFRVAGQSEVPDGWGSLMRIHADNVLDDPLPAIMPAIILALWCVSFRLLSRGFRTESPPAATTAFPT